MLALRQCKKVIAVELDARMAAELTKRVQGTPEERKLEVVLADAIDFKFPYFDVILFSMCWLEESHWFFKGKFTLFGRLSAGLR